MFLLNGKKIDISLPITIGDTNYPHLLKPSDRLEAGVVEVPDSVRPQPEEDYFITENEDGSLNVTPRPAEQVLARKIRLFEQALDSHMDTVAREYRYNDRFTFALRAGYTGPWQAEGVAFAQWMDTCNATVYTMLEEVIAGTRTLPDSPSVLIETLPEFVKP